MSNHTNGHGDVGALRAALEAEMARTGCRLMHLTVLDEKNDPVRTDTPAGHRDAAWFAGLLDGRTIHNRGAHYMALGTVKPNGEKYVNTDPEWVWIQRASKAARWTGHIDFEQITDERNSAPVLRIREAQEPDGVITLGGIEIRVPDEITPRVRLDGWQATRRSCAPTGHSSTRRGRCRRTSPTGSGSVMSGRPRSRRARDLAWRMAAMLDQHGPEYVEVMLHRLGHGPAHWKQMAQWERAAARMAIRDLLTVHGARLEVDGRLHARRARGQRRCRVEVVAVVDGNGSGRAA